MTPRFKPSVLLFLTTALVSVPVGLEWSTAPLQPAAALAGSHDDAAEDRGDDADRGDDVDDTGDADADDDADDGDDDDDDDDDAGEGADDDMDGDDADDDADDGDMDDDDDADDDADDDMAEAGALGRLNAANAAPQARERADGSSTVGRLAAYEEALEEGDLDRAAAILRMVANKPITLSVLREVNRRLGVSLDPAEEGRLLDLAVR